MGGAGLQTTWVLSQRYVDTDVDRARWRSTANVRVLPSLQIGVEFNAKAEEVGPLVTWFLTTEGENRPAVFLGTSSDRIGSPPGKQSYYLTAAKRAPDLPVSAYATLNYYLADTERAVPGREMNLTGIEDDATRANVIAYLRTLPNKGDAARWLRSPLSMRQIGAGFGADDMSARVVEPVPDKYDVLLFVEQTTRARPVRRD